MTVDRGFGNKNKRIVTIGGGSGQFALLSGLRDLPGIDVTAVVSMVDSGGSTGRLRDEFGVLPPGDILKCVLALARNRKAAREILQKRFSGEGSLRGHSVGNMLLTMLAQYTNDFAESVRALGEILDAGGTVLPVTTDRATLVAELSDGSRLFGEAAIDVPRGEKRARIERTYLAPHSSEDVKVYPPVIEAINAADHVIIGPGDLYTSITPNFLVEGVKGALHETKAELLYIVNIMTKFGETDNFTAGDFVRELEGFIGRPVHKVLMNSGVPGAEILKQYASQQSELVRPDDDWLEREIIKYELLNTSGDIARHDPAKLARAIGEIISST